ncbi:type II toxin-antitoxin system RelE family toxin [Streptomyces sp. MS19]|uniref:type II toxin-antitoxin system RelE family toxin n=1 Tax=Streptomyces sp. MS19 TaxID=3385972 RepID=UPI00399F9DA6
MSRRYRVQYADQALDALAKMSPVRRRKFDAAMAHVAADPYAHGHALGGVRDRREASLAGTVTVYWVSNGILTISVVRIIHTD